MVQKDEKGAALTEFSLSLLILLPLLYGGFEIGRLLIGFQELTLVAKEATKVAVRTAGSAEAGSCTRTSTAGVNVDGGHCNGHEEILDRSVSLLRASPWIKSLAGDNFKVTTTRNSDNTFSVELEVEPKGVVSKLLDEMRTMEKGVLI